MPDTITLSESAVATLRFRIKGHRLPVNEVRLPAYLELAEAGIMEPDGEEFRFTAFGMEQRAEILERESDRIERERYEPPDADLSQAARALLRKCVTEGIPEGDEGNRPAFRELVAARVMIPLGSFSKGDECVFRFTYWGWHRRFELAEIACAKQVG